MAIDIEQLLMRAFAEEASDLHITVNSPPVYRMNGGLRPYGEYVLTQTETEAMAKKVVPASDWNIFLERGEIDFSYSIKQVARFRMNVFKQKEYISIAARVIPTDIPTIEQLNMPPILQQLANKKQGLILVTGPTGSGKTTTLAAMIDYINHKEEKHIITLEDPIEYIHAHHRSIVQQREVGSDTNSFTTGLRAALRQDPDIILVGEMRDLETISTAITAAETGHLVLATLHTNSASQTINRIIDVFPPHQQRQIRIQLASVIEGVISQRLFPRKDKVARIAATEILVGHPSVRNLIRNEKVDQVNNVIQTSKALGMHTLSMSINELIDQRKVDELVVAPYLENGGER